MKRFERTNPSIGKNISAKLPEALAGFYYKNRSGIFCEHVLVSLLGFVAVHQVALIQFGKLEL
jgi:hypothetical protein